MQSYLRPSCLCPWRPRGKVRDIYDLGDALLFIATDRISAYDCVLGSGIPSKGRVLTQMSLFWFTFLRGVVQSHLRTTDVSEYPASLAGYRDVLDGRSMLVTKARMIPCGVRGARIFKRLWLERVSGERDGVRHHFACGIARE